MRRDVSLRRGTCAGARHLARRHGGGKDPGRQAVALHVPLRAFLQEVGVEEGVARAPEGLRKGGGGRESGRAERGNGREKVRKTES